MRVAVRCVLSVAIACVSLLTIEAVFRLRYSSNPNRGIAAHSDYLPFSLVEREYRHVWKEFEVTYHLNRFGYRGPDPTSLVKPEGTHRIPLMGDSFTLGWGVEEEQSFAGLLRERLDHPAEVVNGAYRGGYSPDAYYAYLVREGLALDPDVVVVVLYSGNDIDHVQDNVTLESDSAGLPLRLRTHRLYYGMRQVPIDTEPFFDRWPLLEHSEVVRQLARRLAARRKQQWSDAHPRRSRDAVWKVMPDLIQGLERRRAERAIPLIVAVLPIYRVKETDEHRATHQRLVEMARTSLRGVVIDLRLHLEEDDYYPLDGHLNARGHLVLSRVLGPAVEAAELR